MFAAIAFASILAARPPSVIIQVPDPVLPAGPLLAMGATAEGDFYVDHPSFGRSDIPGMIRMTVVIVRPAAVAGAEPLWVARLWIDCNRRVYQLSEGRRYSADGRQMAYASFVPDQHIVAGSGPDQVAMAYCPVPAAKPDGKRSVGHYSLALERSGSVVPTPPGGAPQ